MAAAAVSLMKVRRRTLSSFRSTAVYGGFISTVHRKESEKGTIRLPINVATGVLMLS